MSNARWQRIQDIYHAVLERQASERAEFLRETCAGDTELLREVQSLLDQPVSAEQFLATGEAGADDRLPVRVGQRVGVYEIQALIGRGGMGEVYRARDTKLGREVAIKLLPDSFAADRDRCARFEREARILATLNHPHIGAIYGLEDTPSTASGQVALALVLELVEGITLADRLTNGPLPVAEALTIAHQIAEALAAAHDRGIIHRDLKPSNIKITPDGTVKVLDFGLAKATQGSDSVPLPLETHSGVILGTAPYMSPEQARGLPVDKRADIWAFGCVFHEMLTGRAAFAGETVSDTIVAILEREPNWTALPADVPASVRSLIRRCLAKDLRQRVAHISVALFVLDDPAGSPPIAAPIEPRPLRRRMAIPSSVWLIAMAMTGAVVWFGARAIVPPLRVSRLLLTSPNAPGLSASELYHDLALTPDGTRLVYVGAGGAALFVRALDQLDATPITGFNAAFEPFVSPDGEWIGLWDGAGAPAMKKVAITGGPAVTLGPMDGQMRGASWGTDGEIIFATTNITTGLQRISESGGEAIVLTRPNGASGEADHVWPEILPGGRAVLFTITATTGRLDQAQVAVLDLRTSTQTVLVRGGSDARYMSSGHLVYAAAGTMRAVPFDLDRLTVGGTSVVVLPVVQTKESGAVNAAMASDGTLVYVPEGAPKLEQIGLVWVSRQGQETPILAPLRNYVYPRLSPDGTRLAVFIADQELDIWVCDLARPEPERLTRDSGLDIYPVWTPDGHQILFSSDRAGARNLFTQAADGTGTSTGLLASPNAHYPTSISPDGTRLVFSEIATTGWDISQLSLDGTRAVTRLVHSPFHERNGEVSPDGRWLAYEASDSAGRFEIYVRPFQDVASGPRQVSMKGGTRPLWARDSRELFYLSTTGAVMRVGVAPGPAWAATAPTMLFEGGYGAAAAFHSGRTYDVSPDGQRFLMLKGTSVGGSSSTPASMVVVLNWLEELKKLVPTN